MCRSTGMSLGGTMGTRTQPDRFWALGWTTWLSPSNIPSAKMSTARMMVSRKEKGEIQGLISIDLVLDMLDIPSLISKILPFGVEMLSST